MSVFHNQIEANQKRLAEITQQYPDGDVWPEEIKAEVAKLSAEVEGARSQIAAREAMAAALSTAPKSAAYKPAMPERHDLKSLETVRTVMPSFGDFAMGIKAVRENHASDRVRNALTDYVQVGSTTAGGYAVPGVYETNVDKFIFNEQSLASLCSKIISDQPVLKVPVDDQWPGAAYASGTSGTQPVFVAEAGNIPQRKVVMGQKTLNIYSLKHMVPITNEMNKWGPANLGAYLTQGAQAAITHEVNRYILMGSGSGQPDGLMYAAALKTVATGSGQASGTINYGNTVDMLVAIPQQERGDSLVWVATPQAEGQFLRMTVSGANVPVYVNGDASKKPFGNTLLGQPVFYNPGAPAITAAGRLMLINFARVWFAGEAAPRLDYIPYAYPEQDAAAFRWVYSFGSTPRLSAPITFGDGNAYSPYATLGI